MDHRVSWDEYFMNIARVVATRATCDRKHVGAVLVRHKTILSTGYNGSIRGLPHCSESGHMMEDGHCVRTVHAEANAIIQAAKNGVAIEGATIYTTASPCWPCFKVIANSGCSRIVFGEFYRDNRIFEYAQQIGIELVSLNVPAKPDLQPADTGAPHAVTAATAPPAARAKPAAKAVKAGRKAAPAPAAKRTARRPAKA
jgi:dCMP deaminase